MLARSGFDLWTIVMDAPDTDLTDLDPTLVPDPAPTLAPWLSTLAGRDGAMLDAIGPDHAALYVDGSDTLVVGFQLWSPDAQRAYARPPLVLDCAQGRGWSTLMVLARKPDWFRAPILADYFDAQTDSGFFDSFAQVIFAGAGMGGYAACAYSAAAPGARVLAIAPQATLDPAIAGWDTRFPKARRLDFAGRYGFAPAMLDAAHHAVVAHDPRHRLDAMHATLFRRANVTSLRTPDLGADTFTALAGLGVLDVLVDLLVRDEVTPAAAARLLRTRRTDPDWLARCVQTCLDSGHPARALRVAQHALAHTPGAQAEALLRRARDALRATLP
jgi:hypothetical protein